MRFAQTVEDLGVSLVDSVMTLIAFLLIYLAPGDFLFLPRGAAAALRCPTGRRASGFLIKGRLPSVPSH